MYPNLSDNVKNAVIFRMCDIIMYIKIVFGNNVKYIAPHTIKAYSTFAVDASNASAKS